MNQENSSHYLGTTLLAFLAGAAAGAAVLALTTRRTGSDLQDDLKALSQRAKLKAGTVAEGASEAWEGMREHAEQAAADLKRTASQTAKDLRS
jgi:hypothetical protein